MKTANKAMQKLLDDIEANPSPNDSKLRAVTQLIWPLFREIEGCILINSTRQAHDIDIDTVVERYGDKAGFEAAVNHVYLNDYLSQENANASESIQLAYVILEIWGMKLRSQFPNYNFHLVMSFDEDDGEISLRFYRLRDNEVSWYNMNSINNYAEALLIMEI